MSDYIKREDAITAIAGLLNVIEQVDGADLVEVVRCKECKHWDSDCIWCDLWGNTQEYDDGYCSYGERKE